MVVCSLPSIEEWCGVVGGNSLIIPVSYWGEPERAPHKRELGTVVHARKTTAKSGLPHTTVSLVGWFMRNDKRINYVKSIQVHM